MKVYVCDPKSLLKQLASHPGLLKVFLLWILKLSRLQISTSSSTKMTRNYHKSRSYIHIQHYNKNYNKIQDSHSSWNISAFVDIDHPEDSLDVHFRNLSLKSKWVICWLLMICFSFCLQISSEVSWSVQVLIVKMQSMKTFFGWIFLHPASSRSAIIIWWSGIVIITTTTMIIVIIWSSWDPVPSSGWGSEL